MQFFNSRHGKKETFIPFDEAHIKIYVCGPTVYDQIHIGNARPLVVFDVLFRLLSTKYQRVTYIRNITDLDDKIYARASDKNISISDLTNATIVDFHKNCDALNCLAPTHQPKATEHIPHMIKMIETLLENGFAYQAEGHVLFSHQKMTDAQKLIQLDAEKLRDGARVEIAPYKQDARDFVLWKPSGGDKDIAVGWDSPFGFGRPGWHIECSAMAQEYLGGDFDIHGGGQDLLFPHHYNEYAQSRAACPQHHHAKYWLHNGYVLANGEKMSKSLGNFFTVNDILKSYDGAVLRLLLLMTHYRQPLDFSLDKMNEAKAILDRFYQIMRLTGCDDSATQHANPDVIDALEDDLNTPLALSILHQMASELNQQKQPDLDSVRQFLASAQLLGLMQCSADEWFMGDGSFNTKEIEDLIAQRIQARAEKDYKLADSIRDMLESQDILLEDTGNKTLWKRR
ncbi:MAG: cysteine--tRNA ligase [Alphaproteobacteria bacterium]|nr:cysteine--tRNA ligase [Alphaproteobacteria bacterium]